MDRLGFNIRLALWGLRRAPTFSIAVLLSLALGIGANSTMFAILDAVLLRSLPYPHSGELVSPSLGNTGIVPDSLFPRMEAASTHTLSAIAEYNSGTATVIGAAAAEELPGAIASPDLVRVLDVTPALGRFITPEDGLAGAAPVVVLGYDAWQRQMSGDAHVLGRSIVIDGKQTTVVGVMPRGFAFPPHATFWQARPPIDVSPGAGFRVGMAVGRLRPGVSAMQVQRELALVPRPADLLRAKSLRDSAVSVPSTHDELYGSARPALVLLFAAVTLLLLIACANVANLVMARTTRRRHEFAVRAALGASRAALYWQVVGECLLLALGAGALGTLLAVWLSRVFTRLSPESIAQVDDVGVSGSVVLFTIGVSVLSAFLISSGPALRVARRGAHALIGDGGVRTGDGRFVHAMRRTLVVVQCYRRLRRAAHRCGSARQELGTAEQPRRWVSRTASAYCKSQSSELALSDTSPSTTVFRCARCTCDDAARRGARRQRSTTARGLWADVSARCNSRLRELSYCRKRCRSGVF